MPSKVLQENFEAASSTQKEAAGNQTNKDSSCQRDSNPVKCNLTNWRSSNTIPSRKSQTKGRIS